MRVPRRRMAGLLASGLPIYSQDLEDVFEVSALIQKECGKIQEQMRETRRLLQRQRILARSTIN